MSNLRFKTAREALEHSQRLESAARAKWERASSRLEKNLERIEGLRDLLSKASDEDPSLLAGRPRE